MIYKNLEPSSVSDFEKLLMQSHWELVHQDGGQGHFIGWSYLKRWQKETDHKMAEVTLHFSENQGVQSSHLEMNPAAKPLVEALLEKLAPVKSDRD